MADISAIARPYAQAIFELANEAGQLTQWSDALHAAGTAVSDSQVSSLIGQLKNSLCVRSCYSSVLSHD